MNKRFLKAIIFDMDGTLANTEEIHRLAFNQAFEEFSLPIHWSEKTYAELLTISGGKQRIHKFILDNDLTIKDLSGLRDHVAKVHQRKSVIYREMLTDGRLKLRSGVRRLIMEAQKKNVRLAIATSSSLANVHTLLKTTLGEHSLEWFDSIVSCDLIADQKPSPAVYQYALAELGLSPENCVAIEDTYNGNESAKAAGLRCVVTTHNFTIDSDFTGAALVLDQLGEPEMPFIQSAGEAQTQTYVDVEMLESLLIPQSHETQAQHWHPDVAFG